MRTMPRYKLWVMRLLTEAMLTSVQKWEDRHRAEDGRVNRMHTGLWQASQEMRYLIEGRFPEGPDAPLITEPGRWSPEAVLGDHYVRELIDGAPIPLRVSD